MDICKVAQQEPDSRKGQVRIPTEGNGEGLHTAIGTVVKHSYIYKHFRNLVIPTLSSQLTSALYIYVLILAHICDM